MTKTQNCTVCEGTGVINEFQPQDKDTNRTPCPYCYETTKELNIRFEFKNLNDIARKFQDIMNELSALGKGIHTESQAGTNWEIEEIN